MLLDLPLILELALLGVVTGFLAGLLGIGGGMVMVPFITLLMGSRGVAGDLAVKMAIATSMATIMFTSLSSVRAHHQRGAVRWDLVRGLAAGGVIGFLSGLVGAGGGFISVPFMTWCNVAIHNAVATSAALGFPIALTNVLGYVISGHGLSGLPAGSLGYIWLPALAVIALGSVFTAPLGARAAHSLPVADLKRVFASVLYLLAAYMLYKGLAG